MMVVGALMMLYGSACAMLRVPAERLMADPAAAQAATIVACARRAELRT